MSNPISRRALVVLATLLLLAVTTAALAHGHPHAKPAHEPDCTICMAVHSATHAVAVPVVTLYFTPVQTAFLVYSRSPILAFVHFLLTQNRAPPPQL
jgi:hypothetical protein